MPAPRSANATARSWRSAPTASRSKRRPGTARHRDVCPGLLDAGRRGRVPRRRGAVAVVVHPGSALTESLWKETEGFATWVLSQLRPLYLFVDEIDERLRAGAKREAVLCA